METEEEIDMKFECKKCGKTFEYYPSVNEGVWEAFQNILREHGIVSPKCDGGRWDIRIIQID